MNNRLVVMDFSICLILIFTFSVCCSTLWADSSASSSTDYKLKEKAQEGKEGKLGFHYYWDDGFRIDSPGKKLRVKMNLLINVDAGNIDADDDLDDAFPDLEGSTIELRRFQLHVSGTVSDSMDFKAQFEFSDDEFNMKDLWYGFNQVPHLGHLRIGHLKEPFSLEELTGSQSITFMERSLPTRAFAPGRNAGIRIDNAGLGKRLHWSLGAFLSIGDLKNEDDLFDVFNEHSGYDLTARIGGIPWYSENAEKLVHLGASYSHFFRDDGDSDARLRASSRPESFLTDERLVDTGEVFTDGADLTDIEVAIVSGPFSLQGELFHIFTDAEGDPHYWGFYIYGSFFLTGESRQYDVSKATFTPEEPEHGFRPRKGRWGAWEIAFRYSYIDLNDKGIRGGKEKNLTAGLNLYMGPKVRLMFNYVHARVEDRAEPYIHDKSADIFQTRFQITF
jgi:phosphate-selective porin OprO/OprP